VTLRCGGSKPLLIKSPVHTARIPLLLRLFPQARFIYLHRDPYEVFQSATHMADAYYWFSFLQQPRDEQITEWVLWQYQHLFERYIAARPLLRSSHLLEVPFHELDDAPLRVLRRVYDHFGYTPLQTAHIDQVLLRVDLLDSHGRWKRPCLQTAHIDQMLLRVDLVDSHGRWKRPCLQTAHMARGY
jgi:hypothetical protein